MSDLFVTPPAPAGRQNWHQDPQDWAYAQERLRHDQAVDTWGEYTMFVLLWHVWDLQAGLVGHCPTCYLSQGLIAEVYGQPSQSKCPDCLGPTFEGGYKAKIVRPAMWSNNEEDYKRAARGEVVTQTTSVQSSADFRLRTGDFLLRADNTRWVMRTLSSNELHTGLSVGGPQIVLGYNYGTCAREDESSVAFLIEPTAPVLSARLNQRHAHFRQDFTDLEVVRGPLTS